MKKLMIALLVMFLVFPMFGNKQAAANVFNDVPVNHVFSKEISFLLTKGVISSSGPFGVNEHVNRVEVAVMISRALGLNGDKVTTPFKDVPKSSEFSGYINSAVQSGIIQGYSDGTFRPNEAVTRGQMAIFIARAFKLSVESPLEFKDVNPKTASYSAIKKIVKANITTGYSDKTFRPNDPLTRGQISAFIARAMQKYPDIGIGTYVIPGINFTMSPSQVEKAETAKLLNKVVDGNKTSLIYEVEKFKYNAHLTYSFIDGKLTSIVYDLDPGKKYNLSWNEMLYLHAIIHGRAEKELGTPDIVQPIKETSVATYWNKGTYSVLLSLKKDKTHTAVQLIYRDIVPF